MADEFFGRKLKQLRNLCGYTQVQVANMLGTARNTISNWENCVSEPDALTLIKLCRIYGIDSFDFFDGGGNEGRADGRGVGEAEDEVRLLLLFRKLNDEGRERLLDAADAFVISGKYKKRDKFGVGMEA